MRGRKSGPPLPKKKRGYGLHAGQRASGRWAAPIKCWGRPGVGRGDAHVDIYLKDSVDQEAARQLADEVRSTSGVDWVNYVSKDEALARLKEDLKDHPQVLADLPVNPLPASIEAFVPDLTDRKRLAESMSARAEVDEVRYPEAASIQILREAFQQLQERASPAGSTSSTTAP